MKDSTLITVEIIQRYSHIVSRSLNNKAIGYFDSSQSQILPGDSFVICSDGVHNIFSESMVTNLINTQPLSLQQLIDYCAEYAKDNFSIIILNL
jgi:serine/threonine protein phosphatase PrpC